MQFIDAQPFHTTASLTPPSVSQGHWTLENAFD
jgi:hypothetical protein